jgi:hypothetical protein
MTNAWPWLVLLAKQPPLLYPPKYFPRKFQTREDAEAMLARVAAEGGKATLTTYAFYFQEDADDSTKH